MVQNYPTIISLLICVGMEVLFSFLFFTYWIKRRSDKVSLTLTFWFIIASLYHYFRLMQFITVNDEFAIFYAKASGICHYLIIYLCWLFIHFYINTKPKKKEIILWSLLVFIPAFIFIFSEIYVTNQIIIRQTVFNESFYSLEPGLFYHYFGCLRPCMLLFLCYKLIKAPSPEYRERIYVIIGFAIASLFSISDMISVLLNLKWIRIYDYAYLPIGIMILFILIDRYNLMFNNLEMLVEIRTNELTETNLSYKKEIEIRIKTEKELANYKDNLELIIEKRTEELNNSVHEYLAVNEELTSTNEILEDQRSKLQNTLHTLKLAKDQIVQSEKMAALGIMTAGVAHEINNPLNFIVGGIANLETYIKNLQLLGKNDNEWITQLKEKYAYDLPTEITEIEELISFIKTGSERISEIVKSLSVFARSDSEKMEETDIHESLNAALVIMQYQIKGRISITKHYNNIPKILCTSGKLNQVFINLISNAIHAIDEIGEIKITTNYHPSSSSIEISIHDSGKGIPPEIQNKIFEPFFTTKDAGVGTGLGLSIVYSIIEQLKGTIQMKSEPKNGTEFIITLPVNMQMN
jgi:signal transduction histidine kinase